jgi:hypothetical protein
MIMVGDARLAIAGVTLNAMVWLTVAIWVRRLKRRRLSESVSIKLATFGLADPRGKIEYVLTLP